MTCNKKKGGVFALLFVLYSFRAGVSCCNLVDFIYLNSLCYGCGTGYNPLFDFG